MTKTEERKCVTGPVFPPDLPPMVGDVYAQHLSVGVTAHLTATYLLYQHSITKYLSTSFISLPRAYPMGLVYTFISMT